MPRFIVYALVVAQFSLILLSLFSSNGVDYWWQWLLVLVGAFIGVWAVVTMKLRVSVLPTAEHVEKLYISGPYRWIRHPMYLGVLLICAGFLADGTITILKVLLWAGLVGVLVMKMYLEESALKASLTTYAAYLKKTKRLLPFIY